MSAACVLGAPKRAALPNPTLHDLSPLAASPGPHQAGYGQSSRGEYDKELRNIQQHRHSTPYVKQHNQLGAEDTNTATTSPTADSIRSGQGAIHNNDNYPSPLDVHELDLTPRLVSQPASYGRRRSYAHNHGQPLAISPRDDLDDDDDDESSFVTPRPAAAAAALYEQPALGKRFSAQFRPLPNLDSDLSTFKRQPNGRLSSASSAALKANINGRARSHTTTTAPDCNSLDSFQSRSSASSSVGVSPVPAAMVTTCQPHARQPSVLIGTRYVRPPSVPPAISSSAISAAPAAQVSEWREVPLADGAPDTTSAGRNKKKGKSSFWSCTKVRTNKSGIGGGGGPVGKKQFNEEKSQTSPPPVGIDRKDHRLSGQPQLGEKHSKLGNDGGGGKDNNNSKGESRRDSRASSVASNQPAGQIGKSRAPFLFAGILGSILASLFFSLGLLTIKLLPDGHGLAEKTKIVCFRGLAMMILCAGTIVYQKSTFIVRRDELLVNVLRSILGFAGIYGAYMSLKYISMGDSSALVFSSPVWTSLLSHFILKEPLQWIQLVALPLSIMGIVLIAHPSLLINMEHQAGFSERQPLIDLVEVLPPGGGVGGDQLVSPSLGQNTTSDHHDDLLVSRIVSQLQNATAAANLNQDLDIATNASEHFDYEHRWKGILIALGTSFIVSFVYIVLKFRKTTPIQTTTFWLGFTTFAGAIALSCCIGFGTWPSGLTEWALLIFNGVCSWLGQCLLQWGLKYEDASVLSVVRTLDVAMTFTLSALFLEEEILWTSILGAAIIAAVVVSIMLNNYIATRLCPARRQGALDGGSLRSSSVTLSTGELAGAAELPTNQLTGKTTQEPDNDQHYHHPTGRHHASVAA